MKTIVSWLVLLLISGCAGKHVAVQDDNSLTLGGCSPLPCCVSSTTWILYNRTSPCELLVPSEAAWPKIKEAVAQIPRAEIVESDDRYLHAKCRSLVFRFVDNLELVLQSDEKTVAVRSSSMIAIFDFGVNRMRIHRLRGRLEEMGLIR